MTPSGPGTRLDRMEPQDSNRWTVRCRRARSCRCSCCTRWLEAGKEHRPHSISFCFVAREGTLFSAVAVLLFFFCSNRAVSFHLNSILFLLRRPSLPASAFLVKDSTAGHRNVRFPSCCLRLFLSVPSLHGDVFFFLCFI